MSVPSLAYSAAVTLLCWALLAFQFVGLGLIALRAVRGESGQVAWFIAFWVGFATTLAYLQVWSLFLPVSAGAMLPLLGVSAVGWAANRHTVRTVVAAARVSRGQSAIVAVLGIWATIYAQLPLRVYDAGIYHLGAIRWAATYPVMPGLGNLGPAYGINSSAFLYLAAASIGEVPGFHIALGLLVAVLLFELTLAARRLLRPRASTRPSLDGYVATLLLLPILVMAGTAGFSTTTYDVVNFVLAIVICRQLLQLLDRTDLSTSAALSAVSVIACLACAAITSKISIAVFSAAAISLAIGAAFWKTRSSSVLIGSLGLTAATSIVLVGPWLMRNAILTGYPLYPDPTLALSFDWSMPSAAVRTYRDVLYDFARVNATDSEHAARTLAWLGPWFVRSWRDMLLPGVIALATPIVMLATAPTLARRIGRRWLALVPVWLALPAWFVTAPDTRYAGSLFWLAAAIPLAFWLPSLPRLARLVVLVLFVATVEMPNPDRLIQLVESPADLVMGQFAAEQDIPTVPLTVFTTTSGLSVYVPVDGDQVWDAPLPSTPYPNMAVRLRCPDTLACGFATRP